MKTIDCTKQLEHGLSLVYKNGLQTLINDNTLRPMDIIQDINTSTRDEEEFHIRTYKILAEDHGTQRVIMNHILDVLIPGFGITDTPKDSDHVIIHNDIESLGIHLNDSSITFIYHFTGQW